MSMRPLYIAVYFYGRRSEMVVLNLGIARRSSLENRRAKLAKPNFEADLLEQEQQEISAREPLRSSGKSNPRTSFGVISTWRSHSRANHPSLPVA